MPNGNFRSIRKPQKKEIAYNGIIILDGPDGTGKTTLAKELIKQAGKCVKYVHLTYKYPHSMFLYQTAALHWAHKWSLYGTVIIDRQWISEGIYANVYRGGSPWPHMGRMFDRVFQGVGTMNVLCLPPSVEEHERRFQKLRGERYEMYASQMNVAQRYMDLWWGNPHCLGSDYGAQLTRMGGVHDRDDFMAYCYDTDRIKEYAANLLTSTDARWRMQPWLVTKRHGPDKDETDGYNHNFCGFLDTAEWLIVGDMCNPKYKCLRYPFLDYSHSSLFLSDCLHEIGFDERRAVYINVNDYHGAQGITEALKTKPNLRIMCLGNDALRGLRERCATYINSLAIFPEIYKTCHPSYAQRFNQRRIMLDDLSNLLGVRDDQLAFSKPLNN